MLDRPALHGRQFNPIILGVICMNGLIVRVRDGGCNTINFIFLERIIFYFWDNDFFLLAFVPLLRYFEV